jgi:hypothetical protein
VAFISCFRIIGSRIVIYPLYCYVSAALSVSPRYRAFYRSTVYQSSRHYRIVTKEGLQAVKDAIVSPVPVARVFLISVDIIVIAMLIVRSPTARALAPTATQGFH